MTPTDTIAELDDRDPTGRGYIVHLPIFEGPLDLLLHLVRSQKFDIFDLPLAQLTAQYLDYLAALDGLDLDISGDFLVMAATLMEWKSRSLLPRPPALADEDEEEEEDPRRALAERLLVYEQFRLAAEALRRREDEFRQVVFRADEEGMPVRRVLAVRPKAALWVWATMCDVLTRAVAATDLAPPPPRVSFRQMLGRVQVLLRRAGPQGVSLLALMPEAASRWEIAMVFLVILEMAHRREVRAVQNGLWGEVVLYGDRN